MKRNAFDVLRRGFENVVANWPLVLIRVGEGLALLAIVVGAVVAAVVPILVSAGLSHFDVNHPDDAAQIIGSLLIEHWILLVYLFGLAFVILGVMIAVHSFVEAGSARIYIDGERVPGFRAFSGERWWAGGRRGWWPVFWIYNFAWSVGGLILLVPLLATIVLMFAVGGAGPRIVVGCLGLALAVVLMIPLAILIGIWTQKAIAVCVARSLGAADALRAARREIKLDFGRHLGVALIVMVVSFAAASVISGLSIPFSLAGHNRGLDLAAIMLAPARMVLSVIQSAISAAIGAWLLACFVALTEE